jgi:hypothetical protein
MPSANALTSEHKCEGNHKQDASCQHENFGSVKKFNHLHGHASSARHPMKSSLDETKDEIMSAVVSRIRTGRNRYILSPQRPTAIV